MLPHDGSPAADASYRKRAHGLSVRRGPVGCPGVGCAADSSGCAKEQCTASLTRVVIGARHTLCATACIDDSFRHPSHTHLRVCLLSHGTQPQKAIQVCTSARPQSPPSSTSPDESACAKLSSATPADDLEHHCRETGSFDVNTLQSAETPPAEARRSLASTLAFVARPLVPLPL